MPRKQYIVRLSGDDRTRLHELVRHGRHSAWSLQRARILLHTDTGGRGPALSDEQVASAVGVSARTVARARQAWCERRWDALERKARLPEANPSKLDHAHCARIVAVACSTPPDGYARWSLRLLANRIMELEIIDTISHETVRMVLKKTNANPGNELGSLFRPSGMHRL